MEGLPLDVPPFEVSIDWDRGRPVIHVRGELDYATAPAFERALRRAASGDAIDLILDFHGVTFLDSEGLKVLLRVYRDLRERNGSITIRGCSRFVAKTFEILGLEAHFGVHAEENTAADS